MKNNNPIHMALTYIITRGCRKEPLNFNGGEGA